MLSRASSKGKLRRSKSSASVRSHRPPPAAEPFDPCLARAHALTAASLAMQRHSQRSSGDSKGSLDHGYGEDEVPPLPLRGHSRRYSGNRNFAGFDTPSRAVTPTRAYSVREGSLEPVPEIPTDAREFGLEDGAPSQPSSYRKLRKAKSMFSTRQRRGQPLNSEAPAGGFTRTTLRRSLSFFKKPPTVRNRHEYSDPQDIAVQLARDQFLNHLEEQGTPDASPSAASRPQHQSKPFRKSFRSTSTGDPSDGVEGEFWKDRLRRSKSRRFSISIKNGLRRIFGRSSTSQDEPPPVPISPRRFKSSVTESPRSSTGTVIAGSEASHLQSPHYGQPELDHMSKSTAHRAGSLRTLRSSDSMRTSTSRVSSWTDSTAQNTLTTRHGETDQNQLSVIQEHVVPQPANQTGRVSSASSHHDGYSIFRQPFVSDRSESRTKDIMDSQRVYSALMRRIDEPGPENSRGDDTTPKPTRRRKPGFATPTSVGGIRHVPSSASMAQSTLPPTAQISPSARSHLTTRKRDYHRDSFRLTPQQMAEYNEARHSQQSLNEPQSFASEPPMPPGTPTPYGYAASSSRWSGIGSDDSNTAIMGRQSPVVIPQSPSVYSRTTSGTGAYDDESGYSDSGDDRGTVTILASHRLPYSPRKQSIAGDADRVGRHSAEWKEWMNSQMDFNVNPVTTDFHRAHFREDAQIEDDGFSLEQYTGGLAEELAIDSPRTGIEPQGTEHVRFPLVELTSSSQGNFSRPLRRDPTGPISLGNASSRRPSIVSAPRPPSATASVSGPDVQSYSTNPSKPPTASPLTYKTRQPESPRFPVTPTRESLRNLNSGTPRIRYGLNSPARRQSQVAPLTAVRNRQENAGFSNENQRLDDDGSPVRRRDIENNLSKLEGLHSTISTKRMVDMFLDDRRRMMGSSEDDGLSSEPAFL